MQCTDEHHGRARAAILLGSILFAALGAIRPLFDPDLFWHLKTGDWILAHRAVPAVDTFSHTFAGRPMRMVDWLGDVLLALAHSVGGLVGLELLAAVLAAGLILLTACRAEIRRLPCWLLGGGPLLVYAACAARIYARPQTFGLLLAALETMLLERAVQAAPPSRMRHARWLVPPLVCLWSNLHGSSPLGLVLVGVFAAGELWGRRRAGLRALARCAAGWGGVVAAGVVALLLAPGSLQRLGIGVKLVGAHYYQSVITEWKPTGFDVLLGPVGVLAGLVLAGLIGNRRSVLAWEWLLVLCSVWLASRAVRFVPFFPLLAAPIGMRHLARRLESVRWARPSAPGDLAAGGGVLVVAWVAAFVCNHQTPWLGHTTRPAVGLSPMLFPDEAARRLVRERPAGKMFNSFHWGGYLMWAVPDLPVFIDGRTETLYDAAFLKETIDFSPATWRGVFARWGIEWAVLSPSPAAEDIAADPGWAPIYFDDVAEMHVRRDGPNSALALRAGYRFLTPNGMRAAVTRHEPASVVEEGRRAVAEAPASARAHLGLAGALLLAGDDAGYEREAAEAKRLAPKLGTVWFRVGLRHLLVGASGARAELAHAVELAPRSSQFREALALACLKEHDATAALEVISPVLARGEDALARLTRLSESELGRALRR